MDNKKRIVNAAQAATEINDYIPSSQKVLYYVITIILSVAISLVIFGILTGICSTYIGENMNIFFELLTCFGPALFLVGGVMCSILYSVAHPDYTSESGLISVLCASGGSVALALISVLVIFFSLIFLILFAACIIISIIAAWFSS